MVFAGNESQDKDIADYLCNKYKELERGEITKTTFPDSEILVEVKPSVGGKRIIYIKSTAWPQIKNQWELFLTIGAFKHNEAKSIDLVIPYYGHARQDKKFGEGRPRTAEIVANLLAGLDTNIKVYTIDAHFHREVGYYPLLDTNIRAFNITAVKELAKYIKDKYKPENPKIIIPDKGQQPTHKYIREVFDTDFVFLSKERVDSRNVIISCNQEEISSLKDSDIIIFDDMISTGTTLQKSIDWLKKKDVNRIIVATTHLMYPLIDEVKDSKTNEFRAIFEDVGGMLRSAGASEIISANTTGINGTGQISIGSLVEKALLERGYA